MFGLKQYVYKVKCVYLLFMNTIVVVQHTPLYFKQFQKSFEDQLAEIYVARELRRRNPFYSDSDLTAKQITYYKKVDLKIFLGLLSSRQHIFFKKSITYIWQITVAICWLMSHLSVADWCCSEIILERSTINR